MRTYGPLAALALASALLSGTAAAQVQRSGGSASAQLMQQYQQVVAERTQLQADNAKLKNDVEQLKKQLDASKQQLTSTKTGIVHSQSELAALRTQNDASAKALSDTKSKMQELIERFRETANSLRGVESERAELQQQLVQSRATYDRCAETNDALYRVAGEVLDRYQHQGALSYMARAEPFTRLKRTQIDNMALEYKQRADELRMKKASTASVSAPPVTAK